MQHRTVRVSFPVKLLSALPVGRFSDTAGEGVVADARMV